MLGTLRNRFRGGSEPSSSGDSLNAQMRGLLEKIDFFNGLEEKILKQIADTVIRKAFACDEVVVRQGEMGLGLYIIVRGKVKVEREQEGAAPIKVAELGQEQFFAEMSIVDNKPRSATVTATEDTECLLLTRDAFVNLMQKYPEIPIRVARMLADRLRTADEKLAAIPGGHGGPAPAPAAAPAADPGAAAAASNNGTGATPAEGQPQGNKAKVQQALLGAFQNLYTLKAFTRFSVAVLGCPVEGASPELAAEIRIGDVKALILDTSQGASVNIGAHGAGAFTLHVFTPEAGTPLRFGPVPIREGDRFELRVQDAQARLKPIRSARAEKLPPSGF